MWALCIRVDDGNDSRLDPARFAHENGRYNPSILHDPICKSSAILPLNPPSLSLACPRRVSTVVPSLSQSRIWAKDEIVPVAKK